MMSVLLSDRDYRQICRIVYEHSRIHLGENKRELVTARLGKRLRATGLPAYRDYCELLSSPSGEAEIESLVDVISTNHTFFFREPNHFEFLERVALPEFVSGGWIRRGATLRCWSAACSSGEEPYSLAMTFDRFRVQRSDFLWELDASDICSDVLARARPGIYARDRLSGTPPDTLRRYFQRGVGQQDGRVRVKSEIRARVRWHRINLFQESYPFANGFHIIFCRNVMIYFDRPSQEQLIARLFSQLIPGGYLMIGHSESLSGIRSPLQSVQPAVYRRSWR